jgi:hypothetical protein
MEGGWRIVKKGDEEVYHHHSDLNPNNHQKPNRFMIHEAKHLINQESTKLSKPQPQNTTLLSK